MTNIIRGASVAVVLLAFAWTGNMDAIAQGSLTPPGPPEPTMKTLEEIFDKAEEAGASADDAKTSASAAAVAAELAALNAANADTSASNAAVNSADARDNADAAMRAAETAAANALNALEAAEAAQDTRTPIRDKDLPLVIDSPGSYYLAETIRFDQLETDGIVITTDSVTIDLNGFALIGPGATAETLGSGIVTSTSLRNIAVMNGTVSNWGGNGVDLNGSTGFDAASPPNALVKSIRADRNGGNGIHVGESSVVSECVATSNSSDGIQTDRGCVVIGCSSGNNGRGYFVNPGSVLHKCSAWSNEGDGMRAQGGSVVSACTALDNGDDGISTSAGCTVVHCSAQGNAGRGFGAGAGSQVSYCTARANGSHGIEISNDSRVSFNICEGNGTDNATVDAGIFSPSIRNHVEGNYLSGNEVGIFLINNLGMNFVVKNTATDNDTNYSIDNDNTFGPIVSGGGEITETNPYANFSF